MSSAASGIAPLDQARGNLSELAEQVKAGAEKIINENGKSCFAPIDADRPDHHHRLEREHIHPLLIEDARRGLADIAAGRTHGADETIAKLQKHREAGATSSAQRARRG